MPRSYWGVIVALGLILGGAAPPKKQDVAEQPPAKVEPTAPPAPNYSPYPGYKPDPCYQAKDHDAADLCAQWRAAIAAEKAADTSHQSNLIGGVGALLSFISIVLVFFALRQTERSLSEAREANEIAQDAQRAWVTLKVSPIRAEAFRDGLLFTIDTAGKNIGATEATHFNLETAVFFKRQGDVHTDHVAQQIESKLREWTLAYDSDQNSILAPQDTEIDTYIQPDADEHMWWTGTPLGPVCQPIFLVAVFYRTITHPKKVQVTYRSHYISEVDGRGKPSTFVRRGHEAFRTEKLVALPFGATARHYEYDANDDSRHRS